MAAVRKRQKLSQGTSSLQNQIENETPDLSHDKSEQASSQKDPRTLFVRLLHPETTTEDLTNHFSQSYPIKHAVAVLDTSKQSCKGYGFVTFADPEDATQALRELDGSELRGRKIKVEQAQARNRGDEAKFGVVAKPNKAHEDTRRPSPKLIVRNLPWSIDTAEKLTRLFLSFGKVKESILPKNPQGRLLGFGIVIIRGQKNAEKAVEGLNGKEVEGRTLAVDWAADKDTWKTFKEEEAKVQKETEATEDRGDVEDAMVVEEGFGDSEAEMAFVPHLDEDPMDLDSDNNDNEDEEIAFSDENDLDDDKDDEAPRKSNNNSTIFIRNLPFSCVDEDLGEHFEQFGPVRYSRVVYDHVTEQSRGTGFVCFFKEEDAIACIKEAPQTQTSSFSNPSQSFSVLQDHAVDPSGRYTFEGRVLIISKAVDKDEATKLRQDGIDRRNALEKNDKRRLYLLREGRIGPESPLHGKLPPSEQAMRATNARQRKTLVEKNPSLHLSLTRLAVRNIPKWMTSKDLKALARKAIVGFATEASEGLRQKLSKEELARGGDDMKEAERQRKLNRSGVVKQAKIVFETRQGSKIAGGQKRSAEDGEAGRSRGYGFIEYHTHRSALMGLRWLNGHKVDPTEIADLNAAGGKASKLATQVVGTEDRIKRLIVDFALENINVVHRRSERVKKSRLPRSQETADQREPETTHPYDLDPGKNQKKHGGPGKSGRKSKDKARGRAVPAGTKEGAENGASGGGADADAALQDSQGRKSARQIIARKRMVRRARTRGSA
jgi:nucleolar protein 4